MGRRHAFQQYHHHTGAVFGGVALAFSKDPALALIILLALPIITAAMLIIGRKVEPLWKISDSYCDKQNDLVRERLHGIRVIRAFNREEQEQGKIADATRVMAEHIIEANVKWGWPHRWPLR